MNKMIKQSIKPQASRITFYLLSVVMISFGIFAEHHSHQPKQATLDAQPIHAVLIDP